MKFIKNFILILLFILPISNSFGAMVTYVQKAAVTDGLNISNGIHFNLMEQKCLHIIQEQLSVII